MPVIVQSGGAPRVVVVERARTVQNVVASTAPMQVADQRTAAALRDRTQVLAVAAPGPQGPKGEPGASGAGALSPINFAFGDATPAPVLVLPAPGPVEVTGVSLQIEEAFDGAGAQVRLGTASDPDLLMPAWASAPDQVGVYELTPRVELPGGATLILTLSPGVGATRGRGQFVITVAVPTD